MIETKSVNKILIGSKNMADCVYGRNPVKNLIEANPQKIVKIYLLDSPSLKDIYFLAKKANVAVEYAAKSMLNKYAGPNVNNQGVVALTKPFEYCDLTNFLSKLKGKTNSLVIILDGIEDPVNFGSIIRTACCFEVDGIIIGKNRQVQITPTVSKVATGAEEYLDIVRVTNINQAIMELKDAGYWLVATSGNVDKDYREVDYSGKIALVIGSEGKGVSPLVMKNSDFVVKIPYSGPITSLNAHISCAIVLSHIYSYNHPLKKK